MRLNAAGLSEGIWGFPAYPGDSAGDPARSGLVPLICTDSASTDEGFILFCQRYMVRKAA